MHRATIRIALTLTAILAPVPAGLAQQAGAPPPTQAGRGGRGPAVISPEIQPDGHLVFRIARGCIIVGDRGRWPVRIRPDPAPLVWTQTVMALE